MANQLGIVFAKLKASPADHAFRSRWLDSYVNAAAAVGGRRFEAEAVMDVD